MERFLLGIISGISVTISYITVFLSKCFYLAMNRYQQIDYRNFIAVKIRELESMDKKEVDPEVLNRAIKPFKELYSWMCTNSKD